MKILVTGPSCSGKTAYVRSLANHSKLVELDLYESAPDVLALARSSESLLFEGLPSGTDRQMAEIVAGMDLILVLDTPFAVRLRRMIDRDGPESLGRFLFNEFAWHRYLVPLLEAHPRARFVREEDLPGDPFV